jgi:hypothetical protein
VTDRPVIGITAEKFASKDEHPSAATAFRQHTSAQRDRRPPFHNLTHCICGSMNSSVLANGSASCVQHG